MKLNKALESNKIHKIRFRQFIAIIFFLSSISSPSTIYAGNFNYLNRPCFIGNLKKANIAVDRNCSCTKSNTCLSTPRPKIPATFIENTKNKFGEKATSLMLQNIKNSQELQEAVFNGNEIKINKLEEYFKNNLEINRRFSSVMVKAALKNNKDKNMLEKHKESIIKGIDKSFNKAVSDSGMKKQLQNSGPSINTVNNSLNTSEDASLSTKTSNSDKQIDITEVRKRILEELGLAKNIDGTLREVEKKVNINNFDITTNTIHQNSAHNIFKILSNRYKMKVNELSD